MDSALPSPNAEPSTATAAAGTAPPRPVRVGLIGCGKISDQYFAGGARYPILQLAACADLDPARAQAKAAQYGVRALTVEALLADPEIELVVNLTIPQVHVELNERILRAGKHAYTEKPFALDFREGERVLALARERGLRVGSAPDTFLGGGLQSVRKLLDDGAIGRPVAALAFMLCHGHESWHPAPQFYYQAGGGPMFDMGPYYLTALVNLFGPARRVSGVAAKSFAERTITSQPLAGTRVPVEVPTHYSGTVEFANGAVATVAMSFDVWPASPLPPIVVYGSEGTLEVPDPNRFDGAVRVRTAKEPLLESPLTHPTDRGRGSGVADLAYAIRRPDRPHRCSGELANHVVEIMQAFERSATTGRRVKLSSTCERPAMLPVGLEPAALDA